MARFQVRWNELAVVSGDKSETSLYVFVVGDVSNMNGICKGEENKHKVKLGARARDSQFTPH